MTEVTVTVNKGTRIRARWFRAKPTALAGMQLKFGAASTEVSGIVRHVRVDNPENPTLYRFYIDVDGGVEGVKGIELEGCSCGREHVEVDPKHVIWASNEEA